MVGVYIIRNKLTNESYIGQSIDIDRRWSQHKEDMKRRNYALYSDMRFYGLKQFEFSVLEQCEKHELDSKEMYWINKYLNEGYYLYNILGVPEKEAKYVSRKRYKDLLTKTDKSFAEIARLIGVSSKTVQNINAGRTHKDSNLTYPLRMSGVQLGQLKERLKIPAAAAVPRPHVLSPQLLDYISFLSLLGNDTNVFLEFKPVYYKSLVNHFGRDLTDQEILGIINLRPTRPVPLAEMIKAYYNPKLKLINTEHWIKTGFIKKSEEEALYSLLSEMR